MGPSGETWIQGSPRHPLGLDWDCGMSVFKGWSHIVPICHLAPNLLIFAQNIRELISQQAAKLSYAYLLHPTDHPKDNMESLHRSCSMQEAPALCLESISNLTTVFAKCLLQKDRLCLGWGQQHPRDPIPSWLSCAPWLCQAACVCPHTARGRPEQARGILWSAATPGSREEGSKG